MKLESTEEALRNQMHIQENLLEVIVQRSIFYFGVFFGKKNCKRKNREEVRREKVLLSYFLILLAIFHAAPEPTEPLKDAKKDNNQKLVTQALKGH